jgi:hypothetical protein
MNRRRFFLLLAGVSSVGIAGCTFGEERHRSVTIENPSINSHDVGVTVASSHRRGGPGDTEYFDVSSDIAAGGQKTYDEAIDVSDGPPAEVWITIRVDGTQVTDGEYPYPESGIRIRIEGPEDATVTVDP